MKCKQAAWGNFLGDEKVLKLDCGNSCTTINLLNALNCTLTMVTTSIIPQ